MSASDQAAGLVIVVDDDPGQCVMLRRLIRSLGHPVDTFNDGRAFLKRLPGLAPECVCLDLMMPGLDGLEVLERLRRDHPDLPVVMLTADASVRNVVEAMRRGAYDYLVKPVERTRLATVIRNATERARMQQRLTELERESRRDAFAGMIGASPPMRRLYAELERVAATDITVLVHGESGTGKELAARAIHDHSARRGGPYVALNCAAIPDSLIESELFGHEKGAFTGADRRHRGVLERADGGTLLLDEIGDLPLALQGKLLRVLQERRFTRVGGTREVAADFRLIGATHRDLLAAIRAGAFREDLYFRVAVFELELPPLRERREDIARLAQHFLGELTAASDRGAVTLAPEALVALQRHGWPGNVRELRNSLERALVTCRDDRIGRDDLPRRILDARGDATPPGTALADAAPPPAGADAAPPPAGADVPAACDPHTAPGLELAALEREAIVVALTRTAGNIARAARLLGIGRTTLYRKLKKHGLEAPRGEADSR